jgi:DNA-binding NtrC family response regulator
MPRVVVRGPDGRFMQNVELGPQGAALVGRAPSPEVLQDHNFSAGRIQVAAVTSPDISANHVLCWAADGEVLVKDLRSRNGTWLLLPPGQTIRIASGEVVLQLAQASPRSSSADEPATPSWTGRHDYAEALVTAIQQWPRLHALDLEVRISKLVGDLSAPSCIPLANGEALDLLPRTTTDADWLGLLEKLWRWVARNNASYASEELTRSEGMILSSRAIRKAHREVVDAASSGATTLLLGGPSGAGKEMLALAFHRHAGRSGPFVALNCAMLSKELLRSELFGADIGAFTGATRRIVGAVERAQGGTLFLDEIGEMSEDVQPMLLRFLDLREFESLGQYGKAQRADVRVVAATNKDLRAAARAGKFRSDLWFRLCTHVVEVPPLRERWDDVVTYLGSVRVPGATHSFKDSLSAEALEVLRKHPWEGNFRELTSFCQRFSRGAAPGSIDAAACRAALERGALLPSAPPADPVSAASNTDWAELSSRATAAFVEDRGRDPMSWDDQKEWNEKYLKPLLFYYLSGAAAAPAPLDDDALSLLASRTASRMGADRGTALKQLTRYFERFAPMR